MPRDRSKRITVYFEPDLHKALRLKAAETDDSISYLVNEAVRLVLEEDAADVTSVRDRVEEPSVRYEAALEKLEASGQLDRDRVRVDLEQAERSRVVAILELLGLTEAQAIALFYKQILLRDGVPFPLELPNETTAKAIEEARSGRGKSFDTTSELYEDLGI